MTAMNSSKDNSPNSFDISILTLFKLIEYLELLFNHPEGLSRTEIRELLPISSTPEMNCTETLFKAGFIINAKILKGKKFKLTKKGEDLWKLLQALNLFIKSSPDSPISPQDIELVQRGISVFQTFTKDLEKKKNQVDTLNSLF